VAVPDHGDDAAHLHHGVAVLEDRYFGVQLSDGPLKLLSTDAVKSIFVSPRELPGEILQVLSPPLFCE
jgi:hypothetical protein